MCERLRTEKQINRFTSRTIRNIKALGGKREEYAIEFRYGRRPHVFSRADLLKAEVHKAVVNFLGLAASYDQISSREDLHGTTMSAPFKGLPRDERVFV